MFAIVENDYTAQEMHLQDSFQDLKYEYFMTDLTNRLISTTHEQHLFLAVETWRYAVCKLFMPGYGEVNGGCYAIHSLSR